MARDDDSSTPREREREAKRGRRENSWGSGPAAALDQAHLGPEGGGLLGGQRALRLCYQRLHIGVTGVDLLFDMILLVTRHGSGGPQGVAGKYAPVPRLVGDLKVHGPSHP